MDTTKVFSDLLAAYIDPAVNIIALRGGTRSGKTWAALQLLNTIAARSKKPRLISVVSETLPHLKRGAIRDFKNMLEADNVYNVNAWHDTDKIYRYNKGQIEFFSAVDSGKVHGPARDVIYVNECINIPYDTVRHLLVRTTEKKILDYNPAFEFWIDSKILPRKDVRVIDSTYLDNDMLTAAQVAEIESNREIDPDWWAVYGEGKIGSREGLVWKRWDIVAQMPKVFKSEWLGLDWGWTNPTALVHIGLGERGEVWIDQLMYKRQVDNPEIISTIKEAGLSHLEVIADPAEPKSKNELRNAGLKVPDNISKDVQLGISVVNRYQKHYTERSLDLIEENRTYRYAKDPKTDEYTNDVVKKFDHGKDAERYVFLNRLSNIAAGFDVTVGSAARKK